MDGPWTRYQQAVPAASPPPGPWTKYATVPAADTPPPPPGTLQVAITRGINSPPPPVDEFAPQPDNPALAAALKAKAATMQPSAANAFGNGLVDMATFGLSDELAAGLKTGFGLAGDYQTELARQRGMMEDAQQAHPVDYAAGQVAGAVPTMLIPGLGEVRGATLAAKVGRGLVAGGAAGAAYGAGSANGGLQDRLTGAGQGAVAGMVTGAAVPAVGAAIGRAVGSRAGAAAVPAVDELKARAGQLYDQAKQAGLVIRKDSFNNLVGRVQAAVKSAGYHPKITPHSAAAIESLQQARGLTPTLDEVDMLRQIVGQAGNSADANERRVAGIVREHLDDWLSNLRPKDVWAGDPGKAVGLITEARSLWSRQAKGAAIEGAISEAQKAASGGENGLRNEFRKLIKKGNRYRWTSDEEAAIRSVVKGNPGRNALRFLGTFGYSIDQARNFLGPLTGGGIGAAAGGPIGAVAVPVAGTMARSAAKAATYRAAERASAVARNGGSAPFNSLAALAAESGTNRALTPVARGSVPSLLDLTRAPAIRDGRTLGSLSR